jgi:hypothetical protein
MLVGWLACAGGEAPSIVNGADTASELGSTGVGSTGVGPTGPTSEDGPVSGELGGQPWTYTSGFAEPAYGDPDSLRVSLYAEQVGCDEAEFALDHVIVLLPIEEGTFAFDLDTSLAFAMLESDWAYYVTFDGYVEVKELDGTHVRGWVEGRYEDGYEVAGSFDVPICP